jgi:polyisoprenoid-binding protein YceI
MRSGDGESEQSSARSTPEERTAPEAKATVDPARAVSGGVRRRELGRMLPPVAVGGASWAGEVWGFDTVHSSIHFSVRRMVVGRVRGQFTKWRGTMSFDPARPEVSRVTVRIDADSIDTGDPQRDAHLRSPDFLDAERYPLLAFDSTGVEDLGKGRLAIKGALEIRGVTRDAVLEATYRGSVRDRWGNDHLGFEARGRIDRGAFGLRWNEVLPTGELFVGESVDISIEIEATRLPVSPAWP